VKPDWLSKPVQLDLMISPFGCYAYLKLISMSVKQQVFMFCLQHLNAVRLLPLRVLIDKSYAVLKVLTKIFISSHCSLTLCISSNTSFTLVNLGPISQS